MACRGDIGLVDRAGYLYITGRIKDLIVMASGDNILPVPLEQKILVCTACLLYHVTSGGRTSCRLRAM